MTASPASTLGEHALTDVEQQVLYDIFTLARYHSRECLEKLRELRTVSLDFDDKHVAADFTDSDEFGNYLWAVGHLYAALAPATLALVPILAPIDMSDGSRISLLDGGREADLERFLRPIFEQAGIAEIQDCSMTAVRSRIARARGLPAGRPTTAGSGDKRAAARVL